MLKIIIISAILIAAAIILGALMDAIACTLSTERREQWNLIFGTIQRERFYA